MGALLLHLLQNGLPPAVKAQYTEIGGLVGPVLPGEAQPGPHQQPPHAGLGPVLGLGQGSKLLQRAALLSRPLQPGREALSLHRCLGCGPSPPPSWCAGGPAGPAPPAPGRGSCSSRPAALPARFGGGRAAGRPSPPVPNRRAPGWRREGPLRPQRGSRGGPPPGGRSWEPWHLPSWPGDTQRPGCCWGRTARRRPPSPSSLLTAS